MLRIHASAYLQYAYKLQREWKREWNRLTELLHARFILHAAHTHLQRILSGRMIFHYSAKYNRTERLCIFLMVAGCYAFSSAWHALLYSGRNYPTRLETRTKEFNWIASRRVSHKAHRRSESEIVRSLPHCGWLQHRLITDMHRAFVLCAYFFSSFCCQKD